MAEHKSTSKIPIPEECKHPLDELKIFYRTNQYQVELEAEDKMVLTRGEKGKGFWTSDLTVLPVRLELELMEQFVWARYTVDTSGHHMSESDNAFWTREADAAIRFLETGDSFNLAVDEKARADRLRSDVMRRGMFWGTVVAFVLFVFIVLIIL